MKLKRTSWFPSDTHPIRAGLYERDWRNTDLLPEEDRRVWLDEWYPVKNKKSILYPGLWYTDERNEASWQKLPWRGLSENPNQK